MKNCLFLIFALILVSNANCQKQTNTFFNGKWFECCFFFIDKRDSIVDKENLKNNFLKESFEHINNIGNIKDLELDIINDSVIVGKAYYLSVAKPTFDTIKYQYIDKETIESMNEEKHIKLHILYCSKNFLILGDESNDRITLYEKRGKKNMDNNLKINQEFFLLPFVSEYIKKAKLNMTIK